MDCVEELGLPAATAGRPQRRAKDGGTTERQADDVGAGGTDAVTAEAGNRAAGVWSPWTRLAGVAVLSNLSLSDLRLGRGEAETLLSSVFFMGQILCLDRADFAGNRPEKITLVMFAVEMAIFWLMAETACCAASTCG